MVGGALMKAVAVENELRTWAWRAGEQRTISPASDISIIDAGPLAGLPLTPTWQDLLSITGPKRGGNRWFQGVES